jgi:predicted secreted protein
MSEVKVLKKDQGKIYVVTPETSIIIALAENVAAGYQWMISEVDEQTLALQKANLEMCGSDIVGAGVRTFTFRAQAKGVTPIHLTLERGWEDQGAAIDEFQVVVQVLPAQ